MARREWLVCLLLALACLSWTSCSPGADEPDKRRTCGGIPDYRGSTTLFGVSLSSGDGDLPDALAVNDLLFGRPPVVRQFDPSVPPRGTWEERADLLAGRSVVTSFREDPAQILSGEHDDELVDAFAAMPAGAPVFWSYFHEPEPHIADGSFTAEEFRAAWRHVADLSRSACRDDLFPTLILTGYTAERESGRDWRDYYPGDDYVSVLAWDPYNSATSTPTRYESPSTIFGPAVRVAREAGKPWAVAETGSALVPGDDGARRARWLQETGAYLTAQGAAFATYFQSSRDGDFKLTDAPSVAAWRQWVVGTAPAVLDLAWTETGALQVGTGDVAVSSASLNGGLLPAPDSSTVLDGVRFPAFVDSDAPPRAALVVRAAGSDDVLSPSGRDFAFGADLVLDEESSGSAVDNGDNLVQRGISSDATLFKAELDGRRPACTVRGSDGEVVARATDEVTPGRRYRVACVRSGESVTVEVTDLESGEVTSRREDGPIGEVGFDRSVPVSVGAKVAHDGSLIESATDQFNGLIAHPTLQIG